MNLLQINFFTLFAEIHHPKKNTVAEILGLVPGLLYHVHYCLICNKPYYIYCVLCTIYRKCFSSAKRSQQGLTPHLHYLDPASYLPCAKLAPSPSLGPSWHPPPPWGTTQPPLHPPGASLSASPPSCQPSSHQHHSSTHTARCSLW